ncbi:hypothetical protein BCAR13_1680012 [Paraburkholderia caribensis]|nr:hypothetical protein BCAR13_1680012 [Paraburkholderia caribensis]
MHGQRRARRRLAVSVGTEMVDRCAHARIPPTNGEKAMAVHAITAVRMDGNSQRVTHVLWGQVSVSGEQFEVAPHASPVIEVVDALAKGDTVVTVFPLDGQRVAGPEVRRVVDEAGREGIEMVVADSDADRTLADLPRLDHE